MAKFRAAKTVSALPGTLTPDTAYFVRAGEGFDLYCSDSTGSIAHKVNSGGAFECLPYADRNSLRSASAADDALALVDRLGLFAFRAGSDEPDDDESCFATATGRWLLECPHWDVVDNWMRPDSFDARLGDALPGAFSGLFDARLLCGAAKCPIASVSGNSNAEFTIGVPGAAPGDCVVVTPPAGLGSDAASTSRLGFYAWVGAQNTVTVKVMNPTASGATINSVVQNTDWSACVIKKG